MRLPFELNVESRASFPFPRGGGERWRERSRKKGNPRDEVVSNRAEEYRPSARQRAPFSLFTHFRL